MLTASPIFNLVKCGILRGVSDVTLSSVSSIIHESFKLFQKPVGYIEIVAAVREATHMKVNSK